MVCFSDKPGFVFLFSAIVLLAIVTDTNGQSPGSVADVICFFILALGPDPISIAVDSSCQLQCQRGPEGSFIFNGDCDVHTNDFQVDVCNVVIPQVTVLLGSCNEQCSVLAHTDVTEHVQFNITCH